MRPNGILEHVEIDWEPRSTDPGGLRDDELPLLRWYQDMERSTAIIGKPFAVRQNNRQLMLDAGFVDVDETTFPLPFWYYRRVDPCRQKLSNWWNTITNDQGVRAFYTRSILPFTHVLGYDPAQVLQMCHDAASVVRRKDSPLYYNL